MTYEPEDMIDRVEQEDIGKLRDAGDGTASQLTQDAFAKW